MKKILLTLFLLALIEINAKEEPKTFIIGVENIEYYPYEKTIDGKWTDSFSKELLDAFAKAMGYEFEYKPMPITTLYTNFLIREVDFKFPDNPKWQENLRTGEKIKYSDPIVAYTDGLFVLPENSSKTKIEVIGTMKGFIPWGYMSEVNSEKIKLIEYNSLNQLIEEAINRKTDGVYCNCAVLKSSLSSSSKYKQDSLVINKNLPYIEDSYYLSSIKYPDVLKEFNKFLKDNPGFIRKLKDKYGLK